VDGNRVFEQTILING